MFKYGLRHGVVILICNVGVFQQKNATIDNKKGLLMSGEKINHLFCFCNMVRKGDIPYSTVVELVESYSRKSQGDSAEQKVGGDNQDDKMGG